MNTIGCSFLLLAAVALVFGFVPILTWINLIIALPLALIAAIMAGLSARKPTAQPADRALFWIALGLGATIIFRMVML